MPYRADFRRIRHPRLELKTGSLVLVLPDGYKDPETLIKRHERWVNGKREMIKELLKKSKIKRLGKALAEDEMKLLMQNLVEKNSKEMGFKDFSLRFQKMSSKWASRGRSGIFTFNTMMAMLPKHLIKYVVFHECLHFFERKHNSFFWKLVSKKYGNYAELEKELALYWFMSHRKRSNIQPHNEKGVY
ncbi:hypothetical protein AUJ17_00930 [Candidatus Micrarchaeota archaeon CG1_02_47_40]|nr:MAG: hypothetical protein AUJ17_00930 [Candidatus Micrarchaeota archaeon CG1_02_47_40]